jgi:hypothetical protein
MTALRNRVFDAEKFRVTSAKSARVRRLAGSKSTREIPMGIDARWAALILSVSTFGGGLWRSEHQLFAVVWSLPNPKQWHRISPGFLRGPIESDGFLSACTGQMVIDQTLSLLCCGNGPRGHLYRGPREVTGPRGGNLSN